MQNSPTRSGDRAKPAASNHPAQTVRYGSIRATIWKSPIDNGNATRDIYDISFSRSYHDGKRWRDSGSFGVDDLLVVAKTAADAHTWICKQRAETSTNQVDAAKDDSRTASKSV